MRNVNGSFKHLENKRPMGHILITWENTKGEYLNFVYLFLLHCISKLSPLGNESWSPKDGLCQVWLNLVQWFWRRRFLNFINTFSLSLISPFGKGLGPSFPLYPRMLCTKFGWNWSSGSGEEENVYDQTKDKFWSEKLILKDLLWDWIHYILIFFIL